MKLQTLFSLLLTVTVIASCASPADKGQDKNASAANCSVNFKGYVQKLGGSFTEAGSEPVYLGILTVPKDLLIYRKKAIRNSKLTFLGKVNDGYLINCQLNYHTFQLLMCATLDKNYCLRDYRYFIDGTSDPGYSATISEVTFFDGGFTVEQMHLNEDQEPDFEKDGIATFSFKVNAQLQLIEQ